MDEKFTHIVITTAYHSGEPHLVVSRENLNGVGQLIPIEQDLVAFPMSKEEILALLEQLLEQAS